LLVPFQQFELYCQTSEGLASLYVRCPAWWGENWTFTEDELQSRAYNGLVPAICHDPHFRRILDYRYYRLHKRSSRYDAEVAGRVAKWTRQFEASLNMRFDGSDPLAVLQFLHAVVEAADTNGIKEGAAVYKLSSFLDTPSRE
jgi:hypothetical protein